MDDDVGEGIGEETGLKKLNVEIVVHLVGHFFLQVRRHINLLLRIEVLVSVLHHSHEVVVKHLIYHHSLHVQLQ